MTKLSKIVKKGKKNKNIDKLRNIKIIKVKTNSVTQILNYSKVNKLIDIERKTWTSQ